MATSRPYEERAVGLKRTSASLRSQLQADGGGSIPDSYERGARSKGKGRSILASLCLLPLPYGLETATLVAASSKAANAERKAEQTVSSSACSCESQAKQSLFRLPRKRKTKKF